MTHPSPLRILAQALAGEFDNRAQSLAEPTWYVHLKLWHRPVALFEEDSITLFVEQVSVASGNPPYRQRVLRLQSHADQITAQYYGLTQPLAFRGGGADPMRLQGLSEADLIDLPTCRLSVIAQAQDSPNWRFKAQLPEGSLCSFEADGVKRYVRLGFEVGPKAPTGKIEFQMFDKGIDPDTGQATWGALMGPFCLDKQAAFGL